MSEDPPNDRIDWACTATGAMARDSASIHKAKARRNIVLVIFSAPRHVSGKRLQEGHGQGKRAYGGLDLRDARPEAAETCLHSGAISILGAWPEKGMRHVRTGGPRGWA
ncbi:hypothetical protein NBRC116599_31020 [Aquicoccus sp. SU-CL01552]